MDHLTPDDGFRMPWIEDEYPRPPFGGLVQAIQLMAAFMMGSHDAQIHLANQMRKAAEVRAPLPPGWTVS